MSPVRGVHDVCQPLQLLLCSLWNIVGACSFMGVAAAEVMQQKHGGSSSSIGPDIVKGEVLESLKKV